MIGQNPTKSSLATNESESIIDNINVKITSITDMLQLVINEYPVPSSSESIQKSKLLEELQRIYERLLHLEDVIQL